MNFYHVTDVRHEATTGRFSTLESAIASAINAARVAGVTEFLCCVETPHRAVLKHPITYETAYIAEIGGPKSRVARPVKKLIFSGRPSLTGWWNGGKTDKINVKDADIERVREGYLMAYVDADCNVIQKAPLPDMIPIASARMAKMGKGSTLDVNVLAREYVDATVAAKTGVPENAAAVFLLYKRPESGIAVLSKRYVNCNE